MKPEQKVIADINYQLMKLDYQNVNSNYSIRLKLLEAKIEKLERTIQRLEDFCRLQADMNNDLVQIMKLNEQLNMPLI